MFKYFGMISVVLGIFVNIFLLTTWIETLFQTVIPYLLVGVVGIIFSVLSIIKNSSQSSKIISTIGACLNILPLAYFLFLYFTW